MSPFDNHTQLSLADIDRLRAAIDRVGIKPIRIDGHPMYVFDRLGRLIPNSREVSMPGKITIQGNGWSAQYELQQLVWPYGPTGSGESFTVTLGQCLERTGSQDFELRDEIAKLREQYASLMTTCEAAQAQEKRQRERADSMAKVLAPESRTGETPAGTIKRLIDSNNHFNAERDRFVRQQSESNATIGSLRSQCLDAENRFKAAVSMRDAVQQLHDTACEHRDLARKEATDLRGLLKHTEEGRDSLNRDNERLQGELKAARRAADALQRRCDDQKAEFETACALFDVANGSNGLARDVLEGVKAPSLHARVLQQGLENERERVRHLERRLHDANDQVSTWTARFNWLAEQTMYRGSENRWFVSGMRPGIVADSAEQAVDLLRMPKVIGVDMGAPGGDTAVMAEVRDGKVESVRVLAPQLTKLPAEIIPGGDTLRDQINFLIDAHNALARRCHEA